MSSSLLRKRVLTPESSALVGIFAVRIAGFLGSLRAAVRGVEDARVFELACRSAVIAADASIRDAKSNELSVARRARFFVRPCDHGYFVLLTCGQISHEARLPRACAARRVLDLVLADGLVAHRWAVEAAWKGAQIAGERERFDEEGLPIGESIEKELALVFGETVIEMAVFVDDHDAV